MGFKINELIQGTFYVIVLFDLYILFTFINMYTNAWSYMNGFVVQFTVVFDCLSD